MRQVITNYGAVGRPLDGYAVLAVGITCVVLNHIVSTAIVHIDSERDVLISSIVLDHVVVYCGFFTNPSKNLHPVVVVVTDHAGYGVACGIELHSGAILAGVVEIS